MPNSSSELAPNMFGASSEPASVMVLMDFGFYTVIRSKVQRPIMTNVTWSRFDQSACV